jgi:hypothetical protein
MGRILTSAALTLLASTALAQTADQVFDFRIDRYPPGAGDCDTLAAQFGPAFQAATGLKVRRSICEAKNELGNTILIQYEAAQPAPPLSTLDFSQGVDARGIYTSMDDCNAALPAAERKFKAKTGLTPFDAYCFEDVYSDDFPYALRVEGFTALGASQPAVRPFVDVQTLFGKPVDLTPAAIEAAIQQGGKAQGIDVDYVLYDQLYPDGRIQIGYYAGDRLRVNMPSLGATDTHEQCGAELAVLNSAVGGRPDEPVATFCADDDLLAVTDIIGIFLKLPALDIGPGTTVFKTYDDCNAARPGEMDRYQNLGRPVIALLCGRDPSTIDDPTRQRWKMTLIETQNP